MGIERKNNKATADVNKPTHSIIVETDYGNLQVSIFANSKNAFHKEIAAAFEDGEDITQFLGSITKSAKLVVVKEAEASTDVVSKFKALNAQA